MLQLSFWGRSKSDCDRSLRPVAILWWAFKHWRGIFPQDCKVVTLFLRETWFQSARNEPTISSNAFVDYGAGCQGDAVHVPRGERRPWQAVFCDACLRRQKTPQVWDASKDTVLWLGTLIETHAIGMKCWNQWCYLRKHKLLNNWDCHERAAALLPDLVNFVSVMLSQIFSTRSTIMMQIFLSA